MALIRVNMNDAATHIRIRPRTKVNSTPYNQVEEPLIHERQILLNKRNKGDDTLRSSDNINRYDSLQSVLRNRYDVDDVPLAESIYAKANKRKQYIEPEHYDDRFFDQKRLSTYRMLHMNYEQEIIPTALRGVKVSFKDKKRYVDIATENAAVGMPRQRIIRAIEKSIIRKETGKPVADVDRFEFYINNPNKPYKKAE